ncbi:hypothetical protein AU210_002062 [Fusarium oxysporum f. sp. radicis-cucumerinum]|uniref:NAD(P)-binding protein n=1 Tax=Fusarium oxysporum f. sp. radicis-cucumerinum TaxID=327505 RepID=A0A2H3HWY5_FUSOX|nr:hypothetical protein AU210_002062 [Fusarium oxysporum f. sp. radicis-cucumerinum]
MLGSSNKFDPNTDIPDLSGKVFVVTGGSAGIGYGISAHILQHNCQKLYLLGKKQHHLDEAAEGLKHHMQVNVFAQHHLAMTLLPKLIATPDSRLCLQSSDLHRAAPSDIKFADLEEINQDIGPTYLYNRTKLAQVLLVRALYRRKQQGQLGMQPGKGPWINATHPGGVRTDQQEQAIDAYGTLGKVGVAVIRPFMKDPIDQGCRPILFAATSDTIKEENIDGSYIVPDCKVTEASSQALDEDLQEKLWALTEKILKGKLGSGAGQ